MVVGDYLCCSVALIARHLAASLIWMKHVEQSRVLPVPAGICAIAAYRVARRKRDESPFVVIQSACGPVTSSPRLSQDYQAWLDLRELETKLGERYITHESDDSRWQAFALEHTLPYPAHLVAAPPASDDEGGEDADVQCLTERVSIL